MSRHNCGRNGWSLCVACQGRIHDKGCTTRPNKHRDCCPARHYMLYAQGHKVGLDDAAVPMLTPLQAKLVTG
jgi:hypothetical protein